MARKTVMRPGQLNEDTLQDDDQDTKIQVEESSDEDKIRFDTAGTERMIITNNGRVGIGTSGPDRKLDILAASNPQLRLTQADGTKYVELKATSAGDLEITGVSADTDHSHLRFIAAGNAGMIIQSNSAGNADVSLGFSVDSGASLAFSLGVDDSDGNKFKIGTSTIDTNTRLTVGNDGNVGIGTTAPHVMLHLKSTADAVLSNNSSGVLMIGANDGNNLTFDNNEIMARNNTTADILHLQAEGGAVRIHHSMATANKVAVDGNGNVGIGTISPNSKLDVRGSLSLGIVEKTSNYTIGSSDFTVLLDASSGGVTLTLPAASGITGRIYVIKCTGKGEGNTANLATNGSETIDGDSNDKVFNDTGESLMIQSDGAGWMKIAELLPPPP